MSLIEQWWVAQETYNVAGQLLVDNTVNWNGSFKNCWAILLHYPSSILCNKFWMILVLLVSKMFINDVGCLTTKVSAFFVEAALSLKISQSPMICHKKKQLLPSQDFITMLDSIHCAQKRVIQNFLGHLNHAGFSIVKLPWFGCSS